MQTPFITVSKGFRTKKLLHCLESSDIIMARALLKNFNFKLITEYKSLIADEIANEPVDSFWINFEEELVALIWNDHPKKYKSVLFN